MSVQFSRGCPYDCDFCNVTALSGHRPRTKPAAQLIAELACLDPQPESVPINMLVKVPGTPLAIDADDLDPLEFVRTIAVARILMPASHVRLSAGRRELGEAVQALCFLAGANSIFYGDKLLTTGNPDVEADRILFAKLGLKPEPVQGRRCAGHD